MVRRIVFRGGWGEGLCKMGIQGDVKGGVNRVRWSVFRGGWGEGLCKGGMKGDVKVV